MRAQVNSRHEQETVVSIELGELGVAPVELSHAAAVHHCDFAVEPLRVPQLITAGSENGGWERSE